MSWDEDDSSFLAGFIAGVFGTPGAVLAIVLCVVLLLIL